MKRFIQLSILLFISGCMVGPNHQTPENTVSDQWASPVEAVDCAPPTQWWTVFNDPLLTQYIESAAEHNKNVLAAEANILQARALRQVSAAALYPHIGANLSAGEFRFSKNGLIFGPAVNGAAPETQSLFNLLFDAVWELDLFGKTRRSMEAADATIESNIEERNNVLLSVMAEIARNYIEVRSYQKQQTLIEANISLLEQHLFIAEKQFQFGYASQLNVETVQAELATSRAALPDITAEIYRSIYALSVLTGAVPETLVDQLLVPQPLPKVPETIAIGLRSELLRRRPDIRQSERYLAVATANIGITMAAFFPNFVFGGIGGLQSLHLNNLFTGASNIWGFGGDASLPLFQGGKIYGNLHVNQAAAEAAFLAYQQTVLQALEETESALIAYNQEKATAHEYTEAAKKYHDLSELSRQRYIKGIATKIDFLNSEKQFLAAEQAQLQSDRQTLVNLIALYKALGGGWELVGCSEVD